MQPSVIPCHYGELYVLWSTENVSIYKLFFTIILDNLNRFLIYLSFYL